MRGGVWGAVLAIGLTLIWSPVDLEAQQRGRRGGGAGRATIQSARGQVGPGNRRMELENTVWRTHQDQVARELRLGADARQRFQDVSQRFRGRRTELQTRERDLRRRWQATLQGAEGADSPSAVLQALLEIRQAEVDIQREEQQAFLEFLEPAQVLRILRRRDALTAQIRQLQGGGAPGAGGVPGGGGLPGG